MSTTNETNTEIGGIEYNKNYIYSQNDVDTRLIDVLGNLKKLEAVSRVQFFAPNLVKLRNLFII